MVRRTKDLLGALQGLLKSNSGLQFTQACKGNSQPVQGQLRLTRAPQSSTGLSPADTMPSWAKRDPLSLNEGPLSVAQGTFRPAWDVLGRKEPLRPKKGPFRPTKGPLRRIKCFPDQHAFSGRQIAIFSLEGPLVGRKWNFVSLKKALISSTQEDCKPTQGTLKQKESPS